MKAKHRTVYETEDGREFDTAQEALDHEIAVRLEKVFDELGLILHTEYLTFDQLAKNWRAIAAKIDEVTDAAS